jgi:hypothetical protein
MGVAFGCAASARENFVRFGPRNPEFTPRVISAV